MEGRSVSVGTSRCETIGAVGKPDQLQFNLSSGVVSLLDWPSDSCLFGDKVCNKQQKTAIFSRGKTSTKTPNLQQAQEIFKVLRTHRHKIHNTLHQQKMPLHAQHTTKRPATALLPAPPTNKPFSCTINIPPPCNSPYDHEHAQ